MRYIIINRNKKHNKEQADICFILYWKPIMMYNWILILAAVIPAVFLMIKVYRADRMEKESGYLLRQLVIAGILSTIIALIEEKIGEWILSCFVPENTLLYQIILYFVIVAIAEESSKYFFLKKRTWNNPEFNCQYDGVVYAVFVSLGFALWKISTMFYHMVFQLLL